MLTAEYAKLHCPNSQLPEVDDNGAVKQCLPGHEGLCGSGYSCYFSGTNYQCCPTEEEINFDSILECPSPGITILTDGGLPLICTPDLHDCPQSSMQCLNVGKHSICCEGLSSITDESHDVLSSKELNPPDEIIQPIALSNELFNVQNLECPEPAFTILDANGDPVSCSEEDCAYQTGRFCYKPLNTPICCEGEERTIDDDASIKKILQESKHEKEGSIEWSVLRYTPLKTAQRQLQQNELLQENDNVLGLGESLVKSPVPNGSAPEIISPITDGLARHSGEKQIGNEYKNSQQSIVPDNAQTLQTITTTTTSTKTTGITTSTTTTIATTASQVITSTTPESQMSGKPNEDEIETIRYKPHNAGGYAISRAFSSKVHRAPNDLRALAREYLLEHIRRGWPYSDEFYRTYTQFESQPGQEDEIISHEQT
ncbi:unnamed protein product [Cercopithifilaria johnstoni]|uniref:Uncharacterized protein n=1 Tax=Cercopithifilaria johnstoni TaxID=2874296 RepID=A0A8J2PV86_9BILA|nr:unnamed protein product [Cercopithifilaria johnstoni]